MSAESITWTLFSEQGSNWWGNNGYLQVICDPVTAKCYSFTNRGRVGGVTYDDSIIYSTWLYSYAPNATPAAVGSFATLGGTTAPASCNTDTSTMPGNRHPLKQFVLDTKRLWIWMWGGPQAGCGDSGNQTVTGNIVTGGGYNVVPSGSPGSWVGQEIFVGTTVGNAAACSTPAFVGATSDASQLVLVQSDGTTPNSTCSQGSKIVIQRDTGQRTPRFDLYYYDVNGAAWTRIFPPPSTNPDDNNTATYPDNRNEGAGAYDPDHDAVFVVGPNGGGFTTVWNFCRTAENPTPGTLTAAQASVGCTADKWTKVGNAALGGTFPPNGTGTGLNNLPMGSGFVWDVSRHKFIFYDSDTVTANHTTWTYNPVANTWTQVCGGGCVLPPADQSFNVAGTNLVYSTLTHQSYNVAYNGASWVTSAYDPDADTWTSITMAGTTLPNGFMTTAYDPITNRIIARTSASSTSRMLEGQLSSLVGGVIGSGIIGSGIVK